MLRFAQVAKAVPDAASWGGYLDFVDVDTVARKIVAEVNKSVQPLESGASFRDRDICYVYENGDVVIGVEDLGTQLQELIGDASTVLRFRQWIDSLAKASMNPLLVQYLYKVKGYIDLLLFPRLLWSVTMLTLFYGADV